MGAAKTHLINVVMRMWEKTNDFYLGIKTSADANHKLSFKKASEHSKHKDGVYYQGADYRNIRRVIRILNPARNDFVYDIGSGMGRVVCIFARRPLRSVVGIELDPFLCEIARTNAVRLRGKRSPIDIRCEDAAVADLSDGTIYFLYNPFAIETMRDMLDNIEHSMAKKPRKIRIVYYTTVLEEEYLKRSCWHRYHELGTLTRRRITFWRNDIGG